MIPSASRSPVRRAFRVGAPLALAAGLLALTGCASTTVAAEPQRECVASEIPLAELDVLDAPREWAGPSTACLADAGITAIDSASEPQLPVTVVDDKGTEVTVSDASRILALDVSG